jgi:ankyrin repeat protein
MRKRIVCALACLALLAGAAAGQDKGEELRRAASEGNLAKVKELLDAGVDVNAKNNYGGTPLSFASDRDHAEVVKLLLERGADPNARDTFYGVTPLTWASTAEIVRLLLAKGAQGVDQALLGAIFEGNAEVVKAVLETAKPGAELLTNALAAATEGGKDEIVALLKAAGAQPPAPADFAVDAATLAAYAGDYEAASGTVLSVTLKDGQLSVVVPGGPTLTLGALDKVTFRPKQFPALKLVFEATDGKVTGLLADDGTNKTPFKRKEAAQ